MIVFEVYIFTGLWLRPEIARALEFEANLSNSNKIHVLSPMTQSQKPKQIIKTVLIVRQPRNHLLELCVVHIFNAGFLGHQIEGTPVGQQFFRTAVLNNLPAV